MKRVLLLAYHFPPIGGAGVQRTVKFARYLPEMGYEPVVVTGPGQATGRWTPADETLSDDLPEGIEVIRLEGPEPARARGWAARRERLLMAEPKWARWWRAGVVAAARELRGIDVVYASMSPFESSEPAQRLSRALGAPWVADLRDPWALDEMRVYPTGIHRRHELRRMGRALATADAIVMNTPEAESVLRQTFPRLRPDRIFAIPNGFDSADFGAPAPSPGGGPFRIVHTGYLHTDKPDRSLSARVRRLLGGTVADVNILTRSHVYLLEAVRRVLARSPGVRDELEIHLAGELTDDDLAAINLDIVHTHGYLRHSDAISLMRSADLLFLPMHDIRGERRATIVPGKTYEYLASSRPILAAVPDGDARDLLTAAGSAFLCRPADVEAMAATIEDCLAAHRDGRDLVGPPDPGVIAPFERRRLTRQLADVLDVLTGAAA